ncbi:MAG: hypothetical protein WD750_05865 [Gammaproteobacteria bacterium]
MRVLTRNHSGRTPAGEYSHQVATMEAAHIPMTSYLCPADRCGFIIKCQRPVHQEYTDALTECPDCGCQHFRLVTRDGRVETELLYGGIA